jgi:hypothetical protein
MSTDAADFLRWVLPYATACPEPIAEQHIIDAARAFCKATRCWRFQTTIVLVGTETDIPCAPDNATLYEIESASFRGEPLDRVSFSEELFRDEGLPVAITQSAPMSIRLAPRAQAGALSLSLYLMPKATATDVPDFLFDLHGQVIAQGALSTILALPALPFSNPQQAGYYGALFQQAKDAGFNLNKRGQQRAPTRTRARFM